MRTFGTIASLIIIGICCIVFDAPVHISLIMWGLICVSGAYVTTKSGAIDRRYLISIPLILVGIGLVIAGFLI